MYLKKRLYQAVLVTVVNLPLLGLSLQLRASPDNTGVVRYPESNQEKPIYMIYPESKQEKPEYKGTLEFDKSELNIIEGKQSIIKVNRIAGDNQLSALEAVVEIRNEKGEIIKTQQLSWPKSSEGNIAASESKEIILSREEDTIWNPMENWSARIIADPSVIVNANSMKLLIIDNDDPSFQDGARLICSRNAAENSAYCQKFKENITKNQNNADTKQSIAQSDEGKRVAMTQTGNILSRLKQLQLQTVSGDVTNLAALQFNAETLHVPPELLANLQQVYSSAQEENKPKIPSVDEQVTNFAKWGFFVNGDLQAVKKDDTRRKNPLDITQSQDIGEIGYDADTRGLTMGVDYRFNPQWVGGVALGYADTEAEFDDAMGTIDISGYSLSLYSLYNKNNFYLDGSYSLSRTDFDTMRTIQLYDGNNQSIGFERTRSEPSGTQHVISLGVGHFFNKNAFSYTPRARLNYVKSSIDSYQERGVDQQGLATSNDDYQYISPLSIKEQSSTSTTLEAGIQVAYTLSKQWGVLIPHASVDMVHEFSDESRDIKGYYEIDPNALSQVTESNNDNFTLNTDKPDTTYFNLGLGVSAQFKRGKSGFIHYQGVFGLNDVSSHALTAGFRMEF